MIAITTHTLDTYPFDDSIQERRFHHLTKSLRCMVCQNQTLSESYAPLAVALRNDIYKRVQLEQSDTDIVNWVIQEQGAFVAYNPPFEPLTWGLWFGPFLMLACGLWIVFRRGKNRTIINHNRV